MMRTVGIVLAGGQSRRFGSPKAFAKVGGRYFYEWAKEALESHCDAVVIVTRKELVDRFSADVDVQADLFDFAGMGPLAGILSVMESVQAERYVVLPCDMPFIDDDDVVGNLLMHHDKGATAVIVDGRHHPLVSVWDYDVKQMLDEALRNEQYRVMSVLSRIDATWVNGSELTDCEEQVFKNVNTPELLERCGVYGSNLR